MRVFHLPSLFVPSASVSQAVPQPTAFANVEDLRPVDRQLLGAMRGGEAFGVGELTEALGVTATAVRQRIDRLLSGGYLDREKVVAGRGRPTFQYRLTVLGHQVAGANSAALADAMWRVIVELPDAKLREDVIRAVASKLGQHYAQGLAVAADQTKSDRSLPLVNRFEQLSGLMSAQQIEASVLTEGDLPVIDIGACPYPTMTEASDDRAMCKLEEQMISEAIGAPVQLSSCRLDGDSCCQFSAAPEQPSSETQKQLTSAQRQSMTDPTLASD